LRAVTGWRRVVDISSGAMGRRTRTTLLVVLLSLGLQPATAFAVDGDGETTFKVPFQASNGLSVRLEADDDEIELIVQRKGQEAVYFAPGMVSREGIAVKFGGFGEFVVDYQPFRTLETHGPNRHCDGEPKTTTEGFFRGTMSFHGEDDYFQVEAGRVKGTLDHQPPWDCDFTEAGVSRAARERNVADDAATLGARRDSIRFAVFGSRREGEKPSTAFLASCQEVREGVGVNRLTWAGARPDAFLFDNRRGTAVVDPPAPFAGSARYRRRPDARDSWRGSLTAPLLGLGRVRLAGPDFVARMVPRLPFFE
jgi:hypothetical protein